MIFNEYFNELAGEVSSANAMLKSSMRGSWRDKFLCTELLDLAKALKMWGIDEVPNNFAEIDESMDVIVYFSLVVLDQLVMDSSSC